MAAVGDSDPHAHRLQDALKKAKAQAQVRPVAERIASSKVFIERAKKRIIAGREEVSRAQEVLTTAQAFVDRGASVGRRQGTSGHCPH